jgi:hypothetical protein
VTRNGAFPETISIEKTQAAGRTLRIAVERELSRFFAFDSPLNAS